MKKATKLVLVLLLLLQAVSIPVQADYYAAQVNNAIAEEANRAKVSEAFEIVVNTDRSAYDMAEIDQISDKLPKKINDSLTTLAFISEEEKISKDLIDLLLSVYNKAEKFPDSDAKLLMNGVTIEGDLRDDLVSNLPYLSKLDDKGRSEVFVTAYVVYVNFQDGDYGYMYNYSLDGAIIKTVSYSDKKNIYLVANINNTTLQKMNSAYHIRKESLKSRQIIYYVLIPLGIWIVIGAVIIYAKKTL